jgi:hypothetical protein
MVLKLVSLFENWCHFLKIGVTFETEKEGFEITYTTDTYKLYIKRNCFYNPYFEDFVVRYDEPDLHVGFFAEWCKDSWGNQKDKLKIAK